MEHAGYEFEIADPGVRLYGSACPLMLSFNVLEALSVENVVGNLDYYNYTNNPEANELYVDYAQVVRENLTPQVANWKT